MSETLIVLAPHEEEQPVAVSQAPEAPRAMTPKKKYVPPTCPDCGVDLLRGASTKGSLRIERKDLGGKRRIHDEAACAQRKSASTLERGEGDTLESKYVV